MQLFETFENLKKYSAQRSVDQTSRMDEALKNPMPTTKSERWRYTSTKEFAVQAFSFYEGEGAQLKKAIDVATEKGAHLLLFRDKVITLDEKISSMAGLEITPFHEGLEARVKASVASGAMTDSFEAYMGSKSEYFDWVQEGLSTKGLHIKVGKNWSSSTIVKVVHVCGGSKSEYDTGSLFIEVSGGVNFSLTEEFISTGAEFAFYNSKSCYSVTEKSQFNLFAVQDFKNTQLTHSSVFNSVGSGSSINSFYLDIGAAKAKRNVFTALASDQSEAHVNGLSVASDDAHLDTFAELKHFGPKSKSRQLFKGVVFDVSTAIINGAQSIDFGADEVDSAQLTKIMQMGDKAKAFTKPQLEVNTDDVSAMHGATIGQIDKGELFYLTSRGLKESVARSLLAKGFAAEPLYKITIPEFLGLGLKYLDDKLIKIYGAKI